MMTKRSVLRSAASWYAEGVSDAAAGRLLNPGGRATARPRWSDVFRASYGAGYEDQKAGCAALTLPDDVTARVLFIRQGASGEFVNLAVNLLANFRKPKLNLQWNAEGNNVRTVAVGSTVVTLEHGTSLGQALPIGSYGLSVRRRSRIPQLVTHGPKSPLGLLWKGVDNQISQNTRTAVKSANQGLSSGR